MDNIGIATIILIITNGIITNYGLTKRSFFDKYSLNISQVFMNKEYLRIITSGFLHVNWMHFIFNMYTLYIFGESLENYIGFISYILIYFISLIGGNLFGLYIHRNHQDYSAVGASGAISGIIFASIALFPHIEISLLLFPIFIPGWIFGVAYMIYTIYGIKAQNDNIGHEAHLGGGIFGLLSAIIISPKIIFNNYLPIIALLIPTLIFLYVIIFKPHFLIISNPFTKTKGFQTIEDKYNTKKVDTENEIDKILDKINKKGIDKLSKKDKQRLKELSK